MNRTVEKILAEWTSIMGGNYNDDHARDAAADIRDAKVISCGMADRAATQLEAARAEIRRLRALNDGTFALPRSVGASRHPHDPQAPDPMVTYTIGGGGGILCRGIPSLDVAISLLSDMVRYDDDDEIDALVRTNIMVVLGYIEDDPDDDPDEYWHTDNEWGRTDLVISDEQRCNHCHQALRYY